MIVVLNGEPREVPANATVASVIELLAAAPHGRGVAVALQGEVVPRREWASTQLAGGALLEVVVAIQGG